MGRLDGKVTIVTGATSGIGRRTAEVFVEEGATVVLAARRAPEGERLAGALGARARFLSADVTQEADVERVVTSTVTQFGRLDCLFNNAGGPVPGRSIETIVATELDAGLRLLVGSVVFGMKHAAPVMKRQRAGSIINNASVAGLRAGYSSSIVYGAAKAAVIHLTRCVAMELGEQNIRVNSISPGGIVTGIFGKALGLSVEQAEQTAESIKPVFTALQPIQRPGLPDDIAHAALWLASDESSFVNGHDLVVDGGMIGGRLWTDAQTRLGGLQTFLHTAARGEV